MPSASLVHRRHKWILFLLAISLTIEESLVRAFVPPKIVSSHWRTFSLLAEPHSWIVPKGVAFGSIDKLKFQPVSTNTKNETPSDPLCKISTRAIGLNFADIFCILGFYSAANEIRGDAAFCPGLEYAGVVVEDPTNTFIVGQRVLGFSRFGAYSDLVEVPPQFLYPLPDNWTFTQGAAFLVQALTAWHGLVEVGGMEITDPAENVDVVLVHSAAGGVGLWASEIAARRGATVVGVIGSPEKASTFNERILSLSPKSRTLIRGDETTFGRRLAELLCEVHETTKTSDLKILRKDGNGVDIVMESLGGQYFRHSFEALNQGGSLVTFGSTSYVNPGLNINKLRLIWRYLNRFQVDPGTLTSRNIRLAGFNLIYLTDMPTELRRQLKECIVCLSGLTAKTGRDNNLLPSLDNVVPPVIGGTFNFRSECIKALEHFKSGKTVGKIVLVNEDNTAS